MLHPKIVEVSTEKKTGETYLLVEFWKTKAARTREDRPFLINSFVVYVRDDPEARIRSVILAYIMRAEKHGYAGDHSSAYAVTTDAFSVGGVVQRRTGARLVEPDQRDESDPYGVLAKPEVRALRGKNIDLEVR